MVFVHLSTPGQGGPPVMCSRERISLTARYSSTYMKEEWATTCNNSSVFYPNIYLKAYTALFLKYYMINY